MKSSEKTMEATITLTSVVQIAKSVQCDSRGAVGVTSMSMAPFTVLVTVKKFQHIVSGTNRRM